MIVNAHLVGSSLPGTSRGFIPANPSTGSSARPPVVPMSYDLEEFLGRIDSDLQLLSELVGLYFEEAPCLLGGIRTALDERDANGLRQVAHTLKGTVSLFGARRTTELATTLEAMGRAGSLGGAEAAFGELEREMGILDVELSELSGLVLQA